MFLNERVEVALPRGSKLVWRPGVVVGRTLNAAPHYDVRLSDGSIIANVSADQVRALIGREQAMS